MSNLQNFAKNTRKILGVTANYKKQLKILNKAIPEVPDVFTKPPSSIVCDENQPLWIPSGVTNMIEEIELAVIIGKKGKNIPESEAADYIGGYCVALDMTAVCILQKVRANGGPWEIGKGFDTGCPVSRFISKDEIPDVNNVQLWCSVNGVLKQNENTSDLAISIPKIISYISQYFTLEPNDIILTGSPPGMSRVVPGDTIEGGIKDLVTIKYFIGPTQ